VAAVRVFEADQEHALARLRHAVVERVHDVQRPLVAERLRTVEQLVADVCPAFIDGERLHVLHHERARLKLLDDIEEVLDMLAPRIVGIHAADHREALAGRPADHKVGAQPLRRTSAQHVTAYSVRRDIRVVGLDREGVDVDRPLNIEIAGKTGVKTARSAVQGDRGVRAQRVHEAAFSLCRRTTSSLPEARPC